MPRKMLILLDSGPLGKVVHPHATDEWCKKISNFKEFCKKNTIEIRVPEICDYEVRRNLILEGLTKSVNRLNQLSINTKRIIPITSNVMLEAATLWAWARKIGRPPTNNDKLDADVILVAQAICIKKEKEFDTVIILTGDPKDISIFSEYGIDIWDWKQAEVDWEENIITTYTPKNIENKVFDLNFD